MLPKIADFGLATKLNDEVGIHIIQPDHYQAPEVILGCGWDFSVDIWNFGVMVRRCYVLVFLLHLPLVLND